MSFVSALLGFGLRQVFDGVPQVLVDSVVERFRDRSQRLPKALAAAHDKAWKALGVALAGDGFLDRVKRLGSTGDAKAVQR